MAKKYLKLLKWRFVPKIYKKVKKEKLPKDLIKILKTIDLKDPMVGFFNALLKENNLNAKDYRLHTFLIKIYDAKIYLEMNNYPNKEEIFKYLDKLVDKQEKINDFILKKVDLEAKLAEDVNVQGKSKQYFNFDKYYQMVASIFAMAYLNQSTYQKYYDFAYYAVMYINLDVMFNVYNIPIDYKIYATKLLAQDKMIRTLAQILPKNFNSLIIDLNGELIKMEKQHNKRVIKLNKNKEATKEKDKREIK